MTEMVEGASNPKSILIVDDEFWNISTAIDILSRIDSTYLFYQANNGQAGLRVAREKKPDLILVDWQMPTMDGLEMLQTLTADTGRMRMPAIMMSGVHIGPSELEEALSAGAVDFLTKPFEAVEMRARVNSAMLLGQAFRQVELSHLSELRTMALTLANSNAILKELNDRIDTMRTTFRVSNRLREELIGLHNMLNREDSRLTWKFFEERYQSLDSRFWDKLNAMFPELTGAERRLAVLQRLGLTSKEMAQLLYLETESVHVGRSRLRKALGLELGDNITLFLQQL